MGFQSASEDQDSAAADRDAALQHRLQEQSQPQPRLQPQNPPRQNSLEQLRGSLQSFKYNAQAPQIVPVTPDMDSQPWSPESIGRAEIPPAQPVCLLPAAARPPAWALHRPRREPQSTPPLWAEDRLEEAQLQELNDSLDDEDLRSYLFDLNGDEELQMSFVPSPSRATGRATSVQHPPPPLPIRSSVGPPSPHVVQPLRTAQPRLRLASQPAAAAPVAIPPITQRARLPNVPRGGIQVESVVSSCFLKIPKNSAHTHISNVVLLTPASLSRAAR